MGSVRSSLRSKPPWHKPGISTVCGFDAVLCICARACRARATPPLPPGDCDVGLAAGAAVSCGYSVSSRHKTSGEEAGLLGFTSCQEAPPGRQNARGVSLRAPSGCCRGRLLVPVPGNQRGQPHPPACSILAHRPEADLRFEQLPRVLAHCRRGVALAGGYTLLALRPARPAPPSPPPLSGPPRRGGSVAPSQTSLPAVADDAGPASARRCARLRPR